jgi:hypothetical protein
MTEHENELCAEGGIEKAEQGMVRMDSLPLTALISSRDIVYLHLNLFMLDYIILRVNIQTLSASSKYMELYNLVRL